MLTGRPSIGPVLWPLQGLAQRLDQAIEPYRPEFNEQQLRHWYKGVGTGMLVLKRHHLENFRDAGPFAQLKTGMRVSTAVSTQCAVWTTCGPLIALAACLVRATHGKQAACQLMADHHLPLHMWLQLTSLQLHVGCVIGASMLFNRLLALI